MKKITLAIPVLILQFSNTIFASDEIDSPSEPTLTLEPMAVTSEAAKKPTLGGVEIKSLPIASTIVDRKEINRLKFVDPIEVLNRIPGQSLSRNLRIPKGGKGYTISVIDGVSVRNPYSGSTQQFTDTNSFDIERIEIIKGPTSVLYGSNAFGGVVNVITREPPKIPEYRMWIEGGSFDRIRGGANASGTVGDVGYFLDFNIQDIDGFRDDTKNDRNAVSGKLVFHPDSDSNLTIRGEYLDRFSQEAGTLTQAQFDENPKQNVTNHAFSEEDTYTGAIAFDRKMWSNGLLNANFGYRHEESFAVTSFGGGDPSDTTLNDLNAKVWYKHDFDFLQASLMGGGSYYYGDNDNKRFDQDDNSLTRSSDNEQKIYTGFAQLEFSPIEKLKVTTGFRYETTNFKSTNRLNGDTNSAEFSDFTPVAGFTFDFLDDHKFWFSYSEGFSSPSISSLYTARNNNPNLKPEEATNYELGIRGAFLGGNLTYDVGFYYQDITNYIVNNIIGLDNRGQEILNFQNAGEVNLRGVESVIEYQPWEYLRLGVTHTYARNRYVDFIDAGRGRTEIDLGGNALRTSPEHHVNARIALLPIEGLEIELEIDATTSYFTHDNNALDARGEFSRPTHLNLRTTYEREGWELWLHALNLTDELEERATFSPGRQGGPGSRSINVADGFSIYGGVAFNF